MKITRISPLTWEQNTMDIDITAEQYERFRNSDDLIQNIFPNLTPAEREFIKTGYTPEDWDSLFNVEEELNQQ